LYESGARVWVVDLVPFDSEAASSLIADVTDREQLASAVSTIVERDKRIDILVNSVGLLGVHAPFAQTARSDWERIVATNLVGVFEACHLVLPYMLKQGAGRVVNMGSLAGKQGLPGLSVYSAASAGVIAFTKALGKELAATEIRVNCVAPGPIETDQIMNLGPEVVESFIASSPMNRLGTVTEVAELVVWLSSDACSFTTGAIFDASGGRGTY
jgi:3-oxoacyl-[acyl-carrier protein] reductase